MALIVQPGIGTVVLVIETRLEGIDTFVYLGSILSRDGCLDIEIYYRIGKRNVAFGKLEKRV